VQAKGLRAASNGLSRQFIWSEAARCGNILFLHLGDGMLFFAGKENRGGRIGLVCVIQKGQGWVWIHDSPLSFDF